MGIAFQGKCHICQQVKLVLRCEQCGHCFCCDTCYDAWIPRGFAAIKELLGGPTPNCCGPEHGTG